MTPNFIVWALIIVLIVTVVHALYCYFWQLRPTKSDTIVVVYTDTNGNNFFDREDAPWRHLAVTIERNGNHNEFVTDAVGALLMRSALPGKYTLHVDQIGSFDFWVSGDAERVSYVNINAYMWPVFAVVKQGDAE